MGVHTLVPVFSVEAKDILVSSTVQLSTVPPLCVCVCVMCTFVSACGGQSLMLEVLLSCSSLHVLRRVNPELTYSVGLPHPPNVTWRLESESYTAAATSVLAQPFPQPDFPPVF